MFFCCPLALVSSIEKSIDSKQRHFTTIELSDNKKVANEKGDYDPYTNRNVEHPTS